MRRGQAAEFILDQMQMLDQQITVAGFPVKQALHFAPRSIIKLTAFGVAAALAFARFPNAFARVHILAVQCHFAHPPKNLFSCSPVHKLRSGAKATFSRAKRTRSVSKQRPTPPAHQPRQYAHLKQRALFRRGVILFAAFFGCGRWLFHSRFNIPRSRGGPQ